jgi:HK97 family phage major capsid protein
MEATTNATDVIIKALDAKLEGVAKKADLSDFATKTELQAAVTGMSAVETAITNLKADYADLTTKAAMSFAGTQPKDWRTEFATALAAKGLRPDGRLEPIEIGALNQKAVGTMTAADDLTSGASVLTYRNEFAVNPTRKMNVRNILQVIPSATGNYTFYREGTLEGGFATQTHAAKKSIINARLSQVTIVTEYLAGLAPVAKQMVQDLPFMQNFLSTFLIREYLKAEDALMWPLLTNATTGATGSRVITGNPTSDIEQVLGWITNLYAADHNPDVIVMNPADLYRILITKGSVEYGLPAAVTIASSGAVTIMGIPVSLSTGVTAGRVWLGDRSQAGIVQTAGLSVLSDDKGANFDNNTVTYKAEARVNAAILRPDAFIYGDLNGTT